VVDGGEQFGHVDSVGKISPCAAVGNGAKSEYSA
jgi:hypothetical protein